MTCRGIREFMLQRHLCLGSSAILGIIPVAVFKFETHFVILREFMVGNFRQILIYKMISQSFYEVS